MAAMVTRTRLSLLLDIASVTYLPSTPAAGPHSRPRRWSGYYVRQWQYWSAVRIPGRFPRQENNPPGCFSKPRGCTTAVQHLHNHRWRRIVRRHQETESCWLRRKEQNSKTAKLLLEMTVDLFCVGLKFVASC